MLFKKHHLFLIIVALLLAASFIFPQDQSATVLGNVTGLYGGPQFPSKAFNQAHDIDMATDHPVVHIIDNVEKLPTTLRCGDALDIKKVQNPTINQAVSFTITHIELSLQNPDLYTNKTIAPSLAFQSVLIQSPDDSTPMEYYRIDNFTKPGIYFLKYEKVQKNLTTSTSIKTWSEPLSITVSECSTTAPTQSIMNDVYNHQSIPVIYIATEENEIPLTVLEGSIIDLKIKQKYPQDTEQEDTNYYKVTSVALQDKKTSQTITDFKTIYVQHDEKTLQPYHRILIPKGDHALTYTLEHHYGANITGQEKVICHITTSKRPSQETPETLIETTKYTDDGAY